MPGISVKGSESLGENTRGSHRRSEKSAGTFFVKALGTISSEARLPNSVREPQAKQPRKYFIILECLILLLEQKSQ